MRTDAAAARQEQCVRLYQEHKSMNRVAAQLGCTPSTVGYYLRKAGVARTGRRTYGSKMPDRIQRTIILLRATPTMSRSELAHAFGIAPGSLNQVLQMARFLAPDLPARLADARQGTRTHALQAADQREVVRGAILKGKSWRAAAQLLGVTSERIRFLARSHQIEEVPFNQRVRALHPGSVRRAAIADLATLGWSQVAIGVALAISHQAVEQALLKGIDTDTPTAVRREAGQ